MSLAATIALKARGISVDLGGREVLRELDLQVDRGDWLTLVGANGAGKTTLLKVLAGLVDHDGTVELRDRDGRIPEDRATTMALVAQSPVLPPGMRVIDYVLLGRTPHRNMFARAGSVDLAIVKHSLARLDVAGFADRPVLSLSGGERQRVVLARALAQEPSILLLDEPTTALDLGHQQELLELIEDLRRHSGVTIVMTLHDLTLAGRYGDEVALLHEGRIAVQGDAESVITAANIKRFFGADVSIINDGAGPIVVPGPRPAAPAAPDSTLEMTNERPASYR